MCRRGGKQRNEGKRYRNSHVDPLVSHRLDEVEHANQAKLTAAQKDLVEAAKRQAAEEVSKLKGDHEDEIAKLSKSLQSKHEAELAKVEKANADEMSSMRELVKAAEQEAETAKKEAVNAAAAAAPAAASAASAKTGKQGISIAAAAAAVERDAGVAKATEKEFEECTSVSPPLCLFIYLIAPTASYPNPTEPQQTSSSSAKSSTSGSDS